MLSAFLNMTDSDETRLVIGGAILAAVCCVEWGAKPIPFFRTALFVLGVVLLVLGLVGMLTD